MDRAIAAEARVTNEKFASRDKAIELLASKVPLIISVLGLLLAAAAYFKGRP